MDKSIIIKAVREGQEQSFLPNMPPDLFDDFVTWLYERVDLYSFERSTITYKMRMYKQFIKTVKPHQLQYVLTFTNYAVSKPGIADNSKGK